MQAEVTDKLGMRGEISVRIDYFDGRPPEHRAFTNTILDNARKMWANFLANKESQAFISHMVFGDGGVHQNSKRQVKPEMRELFGITRVSKPVIAQTDPDNSKQVIFTAVVSKEEGNGHPLTEMGLKLSTGELFSLATFLELNKTEQMQLTWNWRLIII